MVPTICAIFANVILKEKDMRVIHNTCFGSFRIENNLAISVYDDDLYYILPNERMSDREIKKFFYELSDIEE